ncbi:MAG: hypothetical protein AAB778_01725 [Patescibacteria group bacterium]
MKKRERKKRLSGNKKPLVILISIIILILVFFLLFITVKINNLGKFSVIKKASDGGASVLIIDIKKESVTNYKIDPDFVLNSSYGYGEYKLSSLWILGGKEGLNGDLVAKSIASNFLIPIYLWKDDSKSNLSIYQKIKLRLVSKNIQSDALKFKSFDLPNSILINFVNEKIQESGIGVEVDDLTGDTDSINKVSKIVGTLGTKVVNYNKGYNSDFGCEVYAFDTEIRELLSNIFDCKSFTNEDKSKIKLKLGAKFAERF